MKIAAGRWRGRNLIAPTNNGVRPTNVRVRQSLFNILRHGKFGDRVTDAIILDAFAGTGALGLEALSLDAAHATFFDIARAARTALEANIKNLDAGSVATVLAHDATNPPRRRDDQPPATLVFLDPPYGKDLAASAIAALDEAGWFAPDVLIVVETARDDPLPPIPGFTVVDQRTIAPATLTFLERTAG